MKLELNEQEMELLLTAVEARVNALQVELIHSDSTAYRRGVRDLLESMENMRRRPSRMSEMTHSTEGLPQL